MSCNCPAYIAFDLTVNCFATNVALPIVADYTEQLMGKIEFAGYEIPFYVDVAEGENIVIPNKFFNETAQHTLRFYRPDGSLLNSACYRITLTIVGVPSELPRMDTPATFAATPGDTTIALTWGAVSTPVPATAYVLRRNGGIIYSGPLTTFTDTDLDNGTTYSYTVVARAAAHTDSYAAGLNATPTAVITFYRLLENGDRRLLESSDFRILE